MRRQRVAAIVSASIVVVDITLAGLLVLRCTKHLPQPVREQPQKNIPWALHQAVDRQGPSLPAEPRNAEVAQYEQGLRGRQSLLHFVWEQRITLERACGSSLTGLTSPIIASAGAEPTERRETRWYPGVP
jgi:hypothetical protein